MKRKIMEYNNFLIFFELKTQNFIIFHNNVFIMFIDAVIKKINLHNNKIHYVSLVPHKHQVWSF